MADAPVWDLTRYRYASTESVSIYYAPNLSGDEESAITLQPGNGFQAVPWLTGHGAPITGVQLQLSTPNSQAYIRLGFYARVDSFVSRPGALIADLGSFQCGSATTTYSFATVPTTPSDCWWLAWSVNSNIAFDGLKPNAIPMVFGRQAADLGTVSPGVGYTTTSYGAAWPASFPGSVAISGILTSRIPHIALRVGSTGTASPLRDLPSWRETSSRGAPIAGIAQVNSTAHVSIAVTNADAGTNVFLRPNLLYTSPYVVSGSEQIGNIILDVITAGSQCLVGLYNTNCLTTLHPHTLYASVQVSAGGSSVRTETFSASLHDRTLWWWAILAVSSVTLDGVDVNNAPPIYGYDTTLGYAFCAHVASWAFASGLPSVFPGSLTYVASGVPTVGFALRARA